MTVKHILVFTSRESVAIFRKLGGVYKVVKILVGVITVSLTVSLMLSSALWAADTKCSVCGMKIAEISRNHIILMNESLQKEAQKEAQKETQKEILHVCSLSCVHKVRKHDTRYSNASVADFNHPESYIDADQAFFLIQSKKIKADLDATVMPPYFGAFKTLEEAQAALKKYGDGQIVQGLNNAVSGERNH